MSTKVIEKKREWLQAADHNIPEKGVSASDLLDLITKALDDRLASNTQNTIEASPLPQPAPQLPAGELLSQSDTPTQEEPEEIEPLRRETGNRRPNIRRLLTAICFEANSSSSLSAFIEMLERDESLTYVTDQYSEVMKRKPVRKRH